MRQPPQTAAGHVGASPGECPGRGRFGRWGVVLWCVVALAVATAGCSGTGEAPTGSDGEPADRAAAAAVEVLAFGSLHGDGRDDPEPLAGVAVIAIPGDRSVVTWLNALVGVDDESDPIAGVFSKSPGVLHTGAQFRVDARQVLATPGVVITTTGDDGTAQLRLDPDMGYSVCVLSPDDQDLIAGCESEFSPDFYYSRGLLSASRFGAVLVYFSYGRGYVGAARNYYNHFSEFYWFQRIAEDVFDRDWPGPEFETRPAPRPKPPPGKASIDFYSDQNLRGDVVAIIEDSQIGAWWDTFHDKRIPPHLGYRYADIATLESTPASLVTLAPDPSVYEEFQGTVTVDAGAHLVCWRTGLLLLCVYEEFPAGSYTYFTPYFIETEYYLPKGKGPAQ